MPRQNDGAGRSQDELEAMFLRMDSALDLQARRAMLNTLKTKAATTDDPRTTVRTRLVDWIDVHARPPELAGPGDEEVIEIDDGD